MSIGEALSTFIAELTKETGVDNPVVSITVPPKVFDCIAIEIERQSVYTKAPIIQQFEYVFYDGVKIEREDVG